MRKMWPLGLVLPLLGTMLGPAGGTGSAAAAGDRCQIYVADPGGSGCVWNAGTGFGSPETAATMTWQALPASFASADRLGHAHLDGQAMPSTASDAQWADLVLPAGVRIGGRGRAHVDLTLHSAVRLTGSSVARVRLVVVVGDCRAGLVRDLAAGDAEVEVPMDLECPGAAEPPRATVRVEASSMAPIGASPATYDVTVSLEHVDVFLPSDCAPGCPLPGA